MTALKVLDRLVLQVSLPMVGNFMTMAVVQDIRKKVAIGASEAVKLGMKDGGPNGPMWNQAADDPVEFDFTPAERSLVCQTLTQMDKEEKLTIDHVGLYRAFMGEGAAVVAFRPKATMAGMHQSVGPSGGDGASVPRESA